MPVLDFHLHVGTRHHWTQSVMSFFAEQNPEYTRDFAEEITPQGVEAYLAREGVDKAVVLSEYAPKTTGVVTNEFSSEFCRGADRLIPFGSICLYDGPDPAEQTEHCVKVLGCRGLKLIPTYAHFFPDDPRLLPAYEVAAGLEIPVMFHTGSSIFKGSRVRYGNPLLLDEVAEGFPRMKIVICHAGRPFWYTEAEWMLRRHENTYIDVSGIPPKQFPSVFPHLEKFRDRFVFGSDWPGIPSIGAQVGRIQELPYSEETIEAILWSNGARLLGLGA
ncbi:MAG: amidohydrolase [Desulfomonile tiedjei]|nr:amidohydrolase [Desulfomonile tiedjei]